MNTSATPKKPIPEPTQDERRSVMRLLHVGASPQDKMRTAQSSYQKALAEGKCFIEKLPDQPAAIKVAKDDLLKRLKEEEEQTAKVLKTPDDFQLGKERLKGWIALAQRDAKDADSTIAKSAKQGAKDEEQFAEKYQARRVRCERKLERVQRRLLQLKKEAKKDAKAGTSEGKKKLTLAPMLLDVQDIRKQLGMVADQANLGLYKTAFEKLKPLQKHLEKLAAQTKKERSKESEQLKGKADWDRRKAKVELLVASLEMKPGTEDAVKKINETLKTLDAAAEKGQYADAYKELGALKKQALEASEQSDDSYDQLPKEIHKSVEYIKDQIKMLRPLAPDEADTAEGELNDLLGRALGNPNGTKMVLAFLADLSKTLETKSGAVHKAIEAYETVRQRADEELKDRARFLSHQELEADRLVYDGAVEKAAEHDYKAARELLDGMPDRSAQRKDYEKWLEQEAIHKGLEDRLAALEGDKTSRIWQKWPAILTAFTDAKKVQDEIKELVAKREYANAVKKFGALSTKVKTAENLTAKWKKFTEDHKELADNLKQDFETKYRAVEESMNKLVEDLRKEQPGFVIADLGKRHADYLKIGMDWNKEFREADSPEALRTAQFKATAALEHLADAFKQFAESPGKLDTLKKEKEQEKPFIVARAAYQKAEQAATSQLKKLREKGSPDYAKWEKELNDVVTKVEKELAKAEASPQKLEEKAKAYNAAIRPLEQLDHDIGQVLKKKNQEASTAKEAAADQMKSVKDKLEKADLSKVPMELVAALEKRRKDLKKLLASGNVAALEVCKERLQEIETDMDDAAKSSATYQTISLKYDKLRFETLMEIAALKVMPKRIKELNRKLDDLQGEFRKQPVKEAQRNSDEFSKEVEKVQAEALKIRQGRKEFKRWLPEAQDLLKQLDEEAKGGTYEKYSGKLCDLLKRAQSLAKAESDSSVAAALTQIKEMVRDGRELVAQCAEAKKDGDESPVLADERERAEEKKALELQQEIFEKEYQNFLNGPFAELEKAVEKANLNGEKVDENRLKFIEDSGKAAQKAGKKAKKMEDLAAARLRLAKAVTGAEALAKEPAGAELTSKKAISQLNVKWKEAVKKFKGSIHELLKAIKDQSKDDDVKLEVAKVEKLSLKATKLFRGTAFENVLKVIDAEPKADIREQRKAREEGLRIVRGYRKAALSNRIVNYLMSAPDFKKHVDRRSLLAVLKDLETNLMRCVQK